LALIAAVLAYHVLARHPAPDTITLMGTPAELQVRIAPTPAPGDQVVAVAWQGHHPVVHRRLVEVGPGVYRADGPLPAGGSWKSIAVFGRGDVLDAAPVAMPGDPQYRLQAIEPPTQPRTAAAVGTPEVLMREFHSGLSPFALAVYTIFLGFIGAWVGSLALAAHRLGRLAAPEVERRRARSRASRASRRRISIL
jgi:hypothetical protein